MAWEQARVDAAVADSFGFHALQLGLPGFDSLRANRMPHRWVVCDSLAIPDAPSEPGPTDGGGTDAAVQRRVQLHAEFDALPFPAASLDLVVMPHALELARDPHLVLREVERVLVPDGRLLITGLNPTSLWGMRQRLGRVRRGIGIAPGRDLYLPRSGGFIGYWRLRDWLRLLSFEIDAGRFGGYRPPCRSERWLQRFAWMDAVGDRWWPVLGAVYFIAAVKRVRGMRLVGLARREPQAARRATATAANHRREPAELDA